MATAAYGDRMNPDVIALRAFRDNHLVKSRAGRAFVRAYWVIGPRMAKVVAHDKMSGKLIRGVLGRMVTRLRKEELTKGK